MNVVSLWFLRTRDRGPGGISSEDFPSKARSAFVHNAIVILLSHGEVPSHRLSAFASISEEQSQTEKVELPSQKNLQPSNDQ